MAVEEYPFIEWWGRRMGSYSSYIEDEQERAGKSGAPRTAIYQRISPGSMERDGKWVTIHDIVNPGAIEDLVETFGNDVFTKYPETFQG